MPQALDNGSQPYSRAYGYGEMAGESDTHTYKTLLLCKGQELIMSPTQGQAVVIVVTFDPAISKNLKAFLYGWLPLSDARGINSLRWNLLKRGATQ